MSKCTFCGLDVYLPDTDEHPCCTFARASGDRECFGCGVFRRRWERGDTCPHVSGKDRACCNA
jgi:hypothetical protein